MQWLWLLAGQLALGKSWCTHGLGCFCEIPLCSQDSREMDKFSPSQ